MVAVFIWLCCAQLAAPDERLERIRRHMAQVLAGLPNYTCQQTVERAQQGAGQRRSQVIDTLRLEVSFVGGKELYAWPGAARFGDVRLEELLGAGGAIGSGAFAMHADILFRSAGPVFTFRGEQQENGRTLLWYDFRVPREASRYDVGSGDRQATVPYRGWIRVDAQTLDLVRLHVEAEQIPREIGIAASGSTVEYGRRPIGDSEYLLPVAAELIMVDGTGSRNVNRTRFSSCRQYAGSSVISFGEPAVGLPAAERKVEGAALPAGVVVELNLDRTVQWQGAAVGDPVSAVLGREVRREGRVLLPKGARFSGRLTRIERSEARGIGPYVVYGLRFDSVQAGAVRTPFRGHLEQVTFGPESFYVPFSHEIRGLHNWGAAANRQHRPLAPGEGVLLARGALRLPAGMRMLWETLP